jgi:uncharacterized protein (DUF302 family)
MIVKRSTLSHAETVAALMAALERRGLTLFARVDHAAAAREVGLELADEEVVLFGNPRGGTPLMQEDRRIGIELPMRILVWREAEDVLLAYRDPHELSGTYSVAGHASTLAQMATLLDELATEAAGS